jgi:hypothetical protein
MTFALPLRPNGLAWGLWWHESTASMLSAPSGRPDDQRKATGRERD